MLPPMVPQYGVIPPDVNKLTDERDRRGGDERDRWAEERAWEERTGRDDRGGREERGFDREGERYWKDGRYREAGRYPGWERDDDRGRADDNRYFLAQL